MRWRHPGPVLEAAVDALKLYDYVEMADCRRVRAPHGRGSVPEREANEARRPDRKRLRSL
jgi:hypothetical protein